MSAFLRATMSALPIDPCRRFSPLNECIYCRSSAPPLTDEHIIPEGLGGREYLPAATCRQCQTRTADAENVIGLSLEPLLRRLGIRGKRKKRSSTIRVHGIEQNGECFSENKSPFEVGLLAVFPAISEPPRFLTDTPETEPVEIVFDAIFDDAYVGRFGSPGSMRHVDAVKFARMIAKIAHAEAVASLGISGFRPLLCDFIIGKDNKWTMWVGHCPEKIEKLPSNPAVSVQLYYLRPPREDLLLGRVRLFEALGGPIYDVVVGHRA
jgi:hypothetical protein